MEAREDAWRLLSGSFSAAEDVVESCCIVRPEISVSLFKTSEIRESQRIIRHRRANIPKSNIHRPPDAYLFHGTSRTPRTSRWSACDVRIDRLRFPLPRGLRPFRAVGTHDNHAACTLSSSCRHKPSLHQTLTDPFWSCSRTSSLRALAAAIDSFQKRSISSARPPSRFTRP